MVLLAVLVLCLEYAAHADSGSPAASMTTVSAPANPAGTPVGHHVTTAAHPADCPAGDMCCGPAGDRVRAVLVAPAQPLQAIMPRMPDLPRQPDTPSRSTESAAPACAPDLHVLQVQRT
ncbi:hypothetical protein OOK44_35080 [Streptomyces cellulosae]|nr:hypothetical protein [Streptomyces sp. OS603R]MCX4481605.1 hypothetical protein [Streptomyces cellulosae]